MAATLSQKRLTPEPAPGASSRSDAFAEEMLAQARRRIRTLDSVTALGGAAALTLAWLLGMVILDRWLDLSSTMRGLSLVGYGIVTGGFLVWKLLLPWCRPVNPYYAAKRLEESMPGVKNSVINWLDLRGEHLPPIVKSALSRRAAADLSNADLERAISSRQAFIASAVTVSLAGAMLVAFISMGLQPFQSLLGRTLAPFRSGAIAARTQLTLLEPRDGNITVAVNQSINFAVRVGGTIPHPDHADAVRLQFRYKQDDAYEERLLERDSVNDREWAVRLAGSEVHNGFWYRIIGGDAATPEYRVQVRSAPLVTRWEAVYHYRPYLRWPDRETTDPNLEELVGTEVTLTAFTNRTVRDGRLTDLEEKSLPGTVTEDDPQAIRFRFPLTKDGKYRVRFTSTEGETNAEPPYYTVKVLADLAPLVELKPPLKERVPANGTFSLEGQATDDHGVTKLVLKQKVVVDGKEIVLKDRPYREGKSFKFEDGTYPRQLEFLDTINLRTVQTAEGKPAELVAGMQLHCWLEAEDNCDFPKPNVGKSNLVVITLDPPLQDEQQLAENQKAAQERKKEHDQKQDARLKKENEEHQKALEEAAKKAAAEKKPELSPEDQKKAEELKKQEEKLKDALQGDKQEAKPEAKAGDKAKPEQKPDAKPDDMGEAKGMPPEQGDKAPDPAKQPEGEAKTDPAMDPQGGEPKPMDGDKQGQPQGDNKNPNGEPKGNPKGEGKPMPQPEAKPGEPNPGQQPGQPQDQPGEGKGDPKGQPMPQDRKDGDPMGKPGDNQPGQPNQPEQKPMPDAKGAKGEKGDKGEKGGQPGQNEPKPPMGDEKGEAKGGPDAGKQDGQKGDQPGQPMSGEKGDKGDKGDKPGQPMNAGDKGDKPGQPMNPGDKGDKPGGQKGDQPMNADKKDGMGEQGDKGDKGNGPMDQPGEAKAKPDAGQNPQQQPMDGQPGEAKNDQGGDKQQGPDGKPMNQGDQPKDGASMGDQSGGQKANGEAKPKPQNADGQQPDADKPNQQKPGTPMPDEGKPGEGQAKDNQGGKGAGEQPSGQPGEAKDKGKQGEGDSDKGQGPMAPEGQPGDKDGTPMDGDKKPGEGGAKEQQPGNQAGERRNDPGNPDGKGEAQPGQPGEKGEKGGQPGQPGQPGQGQPGQGQPGQGQPKGNNPGQGQPGQGQPGQGQPGQGQPGQGQPGQGQPGQGEPMPGQPGNVGNAPGDGDKQDPNAQQGDGRLPGDSKPKNEAGPFKGRAAPEGDTVDEKSRRRAGDLQLEDLKKVTPEILKKANMTEEEYRKFLEAYQRRQQQKNAAGDEKLVGPQRGPAKGPLTGDRLRQVEQPRGQGGNLNQSGAALPPPEFREAQNDFTRKLNEASRGRGASK